MLLTTEQIRTLNDARDILKTIKTPDTRSGGVAYATYTEAENSIFKALNVTRAYLGQNISDTLMHNRENADRTRSLGRADSITVEGMEDGYELTISTDDGVYVVNVHSVTHDLIKVGEEMRAYWAEGRAAAAAHQRDPDATVDPDAYEPSDPKHPGWSTRVADAYDTMRDDR